MRTALIIVDVQNDFCPGGALAVAEGDRVVRPANRLIRHFRQKDLPIFCTREWHPLDHCSFREHGGTWPLHCVAGTDGAALHPRLEVPPEAVIVSKGTARDHDAYSGFQGTDLGRQLKRQGVSELVVAGLATDYCVKHTVLDACKEGFAVTVVEDAIRAVNVRENDGLEAVQAMQAAGARFATTDDVAREIGS